MSSEHVRIGCMDLSVAPAVVGVISTPVALPVAESLARGACDIVELRVDLVGEHAPWREAARRLRAESIPVMLTVRDAREGGTWVDGATTRSRIIDEVLRDIDALDIEVESSDAPAIIRSARAAGRTVIGSFHDFASTPDEGTLRSIVARGRAAGADVVKIACIATGNAETTRLRRLLDHPSGGPICVLPMGPDSAAQRIAFAMSGSCLVYGYLDAANAPSQPAARNLSDALARDLRSYRAAGRPG